MSHHSYHSQQRQTNNQEHQPAVPSATSRAKRCRNALSAAGTKSNNPLHFDLPCGDTEKDNKKGGHCGARGHLRTNSACGRWNYRLPNSTPSGSNGCLNCASFDLCWLQASEVMLAGRKRNGLGRKLATGLNVGMKCCWPIKKTGRLKEGRSGVKDVKGPKR